MAGETAAIEQRPALHGQEMSSQERCRLFFLLSGEHPALPRAEVVSILEAERLPYTVVSSAYRLVILESSLQALEAVGTRSLMVESCGRVVSEVESEGSIIKGMSGCASFSDFVHEGESFAVRSIRIAGAQGALRREQLERDLGELILKEGRGLKVDLKAPKRTFLAILSSGKVTLGLVTNVRERGAIARRRPRKRPYFHPSTMPPKLARCMVNLARPRAGEILLDPFCGAGGHLIEAGLIGCRVVGVDAKRRMIQGSARNLAYFGVRPEGLLLGDARHTPLSRVDSIATDPPYGRGASTLGVTATKMLMDFLTEVPNVLGRESFVCLATPEEPRVAAMVGKAGFRVVDSYDIYVHRSLTRRVLVLRLA